MHKYICIHIYIYKYIYVCVYIYNIYVHIYTYTYMHVYIYIYLQDIYTHRAYRVNINKNLHFFFFSLGEIRARAHTSNHTYIFIQTCAQVYTNTSMGLSHIYFLIKNCSKLLSPCIDSFNRILINIQKSNSTFLSVSVKHFRSFFCYVKYIHNMNVIHQLGSRIDT